MVSGVAHAFVIARMLAFRSCHPQASAARIMADDAMNVRSMSGAPGSVIHMCPASLLAGSILQDKAMQLPEGVLAHEWSGSGSIGDIKDAQLTALLSRLGAMQLHTEFVAEVNKGIASSRDKDAFIGFIAWKYEERFLAKGLHMSYNKHEEMCYEKAGPSGDDGDEMYYRWIEYADLTAYQKEARAQYTSGKRKGTPLRGQVVSASYVYPKQRVVEFLACSPGDWDPADEDIRAKVFKFAEDYKPTEPCEQVVHAGPRNSQDYPQCKCGWAAKVFCHGKEVADRKFDINKVNLEHCPWPDTRCDGVGMIGSFFAERCPGLHK